MANIGTLAAAWKPAPALPETPIKPGADPAKLRDAGQQFEALLLSQMLASAHSPDSGWLGSGDASSSSATGFAEQQLAQVIAQNGGLGLGHMISESLKRDS